MYEHRLNMLARQVVRSLRRPLSTGSASTGSSRDEAIKTMLQKALAPTFLKVEDISGGCGAMYSIEVESPAFKGQSLVKQHRLVNEILAKEIGQMHGLTLKTRAPPSS